MTQWFISRTQERLELNQIHSYRRISKTMAGDSELVIWLLDRPDGVASYFCVVCGEMTDDFSSHIISNGHRLNYLVSFCDHLLFPTKSEEKRRKTEKNRESQCVCSNVSWTRAGNQNFQQNYSQHSLNNLSQLCCLMLFLCSVRFYDEERTPATVFVSLQQFVFSLGIVVIFKSFALPSE